MDEHRWQADAACRDADPRLFFPYRVTPEGHVSIIKAELAEARSHCAVCPVWRECRDAGASEPWGVWGGDLVTRRGPRPAPVLPAVPQAIGTPRKPRPALDVSEIMIPPVHGPAMPPNTL